MSWIRAIDEEAAGGRLAEIYDRLIRERGKVANILKVHSLNPTAMDAHLTLYMSVMFGKSGLSGLEREALAVAVSRANECEYCVHHHAEALRSYEKDERVVRRIMEGDYQGLPARLVALLSHATALTLTPGAASEADVDGLRGAGLDDGEILDMTLVVGYFNFVNRIALGLGVQYSEAEMRGYRY